MNSISSKASPIILETRDAPTNPKLVAMAKANPRAWVYEIDRDFKDTERVPPEAIRGGWEVDSQGNFTGKFAVNERYRAVVVTKLDPQSYLHQIAKVKPAQWIAEADLEPGAHFGVSVTTDFAVPENLVRGWWYVGDDGVITDQFRPNTRWISLNK